MAKKAKRRRARPPKAMVTPAEEETKTPESYPEKVEVLPEVRALHYAHHPALKAVCEPVEDVEEVAGLLDDMASIVEAFEAYGIAANQLGEEVRVIYVRSPEATYEMVNPEITERSRAGFSMREGCLSQPGVFANVRRAKKVEVAFLDRDGTPQRIEAEGVTAVIIQHEIDHLDGILFTDHLSDREREKSTRGTPWA